MSHVKGYVSPNKPMYVRLHPEGRKQEFKAIAEASGIVPSDVINDLVAWYLGYTDDLPTRPQVERQGQRLEATA